MRIVVAGLAATYPLGGVFWDYLQYAQGLIELGHDVLYLEDTGTWFYDPADRTMVESGKAAAAWLSGEIERHMPALSSSWFVRDCRGATFGVGESTARRFCRDAELFLNVSGASLVTPDDLPLARTVYIDTDPMYSQSSIPNALNNTVDSAERNRLDRMLAHDVTFSFGENIGHQGCLVPAACFDWRPTRQPVLTNALASYRVPPEQRRRTLTTIGSWDPYTKPLVVSGRRYEGKHGEFLRFRNLPGKSPLPLDLAMAGTGPESEMRSFGWNLIDPDPISATAERYLDFLASSYAEWSVAKHAYVASRSGWFSGRTAVYLALGVPAIVQDTGFSRYLPTGIGLLAFSTLDEAVAALQQVESNYPRHCAAAEEIAHTYFDSGRVLSDLLGDVFSPHKQDKYAQ